MKASPRFADVKSTVEGGYPEIQIRFDQDRAAALGLTTREIADRVVRKVKGEVATRYDFRDRKIDVLVRARAVRSRQRRRHPQPRHRLCRRRRTRRQRPAATTTATSRQHGRIRRQRSATAHARARDTPIRLSAVADVIASEGPSEIHRISQERVAIVSANLHYGDLGSAVAEVQRHRRDASARGRRQGARRRPERGTRCVGEVADVRARRSRSSWSIW